MKYFYLKSTQNDAEAKNSYKLITLTLNTYEFQLKFSGGGVQYWQEIEMEGLGMRAMPGETDR